MLDAGRRVGVVLVERLVLEQRLGKPVETIPVLSEEFGDVLVGLFDDTANLLVDELPGVLRELGTASEGA
jgi:hypothetical protein